MNARDRLAALYEEWRLMSESEGDAIRSLAWPRVEHCQNVKVELRNKILNAVEGSGPGGGNAEEIHRQFRPVLEHLIGLEMRNSEWLDTERRKLDAERIELNRSERAVRRLHATYGGSLKPVC